MFKAQAFLCIASIEQVSPLRLGRLGNEFLKTPDPIEVGPDDERSGGGSLISRRSPEGRSPMLRCVDRLLHRAAQCPKMDDTGPDNVCLGGRRNEKAGEVIRT
jgi:hypothetical protein